MKRVGINAIVLNSESGGLGIYLRNLIDYLSEVGHEFEPRIFLSKDAYQNSVVGIKNGIVRPLNILSDKPKNRILREPFIWPRALSDNKIDLFHSTLSYIPFGVNVPSIITIHDLGFFHFPDNYTRLRRIFLEKMITRSVEKAMKILAVSAFTKEDIINTFGIKPEKVSVIYEGIDAEEFQRKYSKVDLEIIKRKYKLPEKYILSVGHLEPRKNYLRLIEAFDLLKRKYQVPHKLVIVGRENWKFTSIYDLTQRLGLKDLVLFTKFVDEKDLPALYQSADVFVAPSIFEGFGFTPLESMAAGTPVAASNATSIPEVVGDAALFFNPNDRNEIAEKTYELIIDKDLQDTLIDKGYDNIKRFRWHECCTRTASEYQNILKQI